MARLCRWIGVSCSARLIDTLRRPGVGRRVVRQQSQKNLRAHADSRAEKTPQDFFAGAEEKRGRGKVSDAKTVGRSGEIPVALSFEEKENVRESHSR